MTKFEASPVWNKAWRSIVRSLKDRGVSDLDHSAKEILERLESDGLVVVMSNQEICRCNWSPFVIAEHWSMSRIFGSKPFCRRCHLQIPPESDPQ